MLKGDLIRGAIAGALIAVVGYLYSEVRELREWQGYMDNHHHLEEEHAHDWHREHRLDTVFSQFILLVKELKQLEADMPNVKLED